MKVLLLLDSYADDEVGMMVFRLCQRWAPTREMFLQTMAVGEEGPLSEQLRAMGIGTIVVPATGRQALPKFFDAARRLLARGDRPDVVQTHGCWPQFPARLLHAKYPHIPLVSVVSSFPDPSRSLSNFSVSLIDRFTRKNAGVIVPVSQPMEERLLRLRIPREQLHRISLGVDAVQTFPLSETSRERYRTLFGVKDEHQVIVYTEAAVKGEAPCLPQLLAVAARVHQRHPYARFFLIGDQFRTEQAKATLQASGLSTVARAVGQLSAIMSKVYSAADLVVRRTRSHVFPFAVLEAMATATPVVAFVSPGTLQSSPDPATGEHRLRNTNDLLTHAVLLPHPDAPAQEERAAEVIGNLLSDPARRREIGQSAREHLLDRHELNETAQAFTSLWRQLAPDADWKTTDSIRLEDLEEIKKESSVD